MIKSIIFDVGDVLVHFGWEDCYRKLGYEGERLERIADATVRSLWWEELDKGTITTEEAIAHYIEAAPEYAEEISHTYDYMDMMMTRFDYTLDWLQELRERGYKIYILSNWSEPAYRICKTHTLSFLEEVDGAVISYQEHVIKPDPEIYQILCERYQIRPEEAVFLDDREVNVRGAQSVGLHTIHFQSYEQAKAELDALLKKQS